MWLKEFFYIRKSDRKVVLLLCVIIALALLVIHFTDGEVSDKSYRNSGSYNSYKSHKSYKRQGTAPQYYRQPERQVERFPFDPNTADSTQLLRLGLEPWQVRNIYKYRAAGGIYRQKEDFARLYGLTVGQYRELEPFIQISSEFLPASTLLKDQRKGREAERETRRDSVPRYPVKIAEGEQVDINAADTSVYRSVPGIGSYYSRKILDYGQRLGGYVSVDQLDEIDDFPQEAKSFFTVSDNSVRRLNINQLSLNELKRHPYINYYQAKAIVDYRRLHGPIRDIDDLHLLNDFPSEVIERLRPYVCYE